MWYHVRAAAYYVVLRYIYIIVVLCQGFQKSYTSSRSCATAHCANITTELTLVL